MKVKVIGSMLLGLFKTASKEPVSNAIGELKKIIGGDVGSDETKVKIETVVKKIEATSQTPVSRTARGALIWAVSITLLYQGVVRDALATFLGVDLPSLDACNSGLVDKVMQLLSVAV